MPALQNAKFLGRTDAFQAIALSLSRFAPGAAQIVIVFAAARTRGAETTGILAFGSVTAQFISIAVDFGAGDALLQRAGWGFSWKQHQRALLRSKLPVAAAAVIMGIGASLVVGHQYRPVVLAAAVLGAVLGLTPSLTARLVLAERVGSEAVIAWTETALNAAVGVALLLSGHDPATVLLGFAAIRLCGNVCRACVPVRSQTASFLDQVATAVFLRAGSGFAVNVVLNVLFLQADVLILAMMGRPHEVGIYQIAWRLVYFPLTAIEALHAWLLPRLAARFKGNRSSAEFVKLHWRKYLFAGISWCVVLLVFGPFAARTVFGSEFTASGTLIRILALGMPIRFLSYFVALILAGDGMQWRRAVASAVYAPIAIVVMLGATHAGGSVGLCWGGVVGELLAFGCLAAALKSSLYPTERSPFGGREIPSVLPSRPVKEEGRMMASSKSANASTVGVVLAAGLGSRMHTSQGGTPKWLQECTGSTIAQRQLQSLQMAGIERAVVVTGYRSESIRCFLVDYKGSVDVQTVFNDRFAVWNNWYSLALGIRAGMTLDSGSNFLVMNSDLVLPSPWVRDFVLDASAAGGAITLAVDFAQPVRDEAMKVVCDSTATGQKVSQIGKVSLSRPPAGEYIGMALIGRSRVDSLQQALNILRDDERLHNEWYERAFDMLMAGDVVFNTWATPNSNWVEVDDPGDLENAKVLTGGYQ